MQTAETLPPADAAAMLDLDSLRAALLVRDPYDYVIVPNFVRGEAFEAIVKDYPALEKPGSFPLASVTGGPAFSQFIAALDGEDFRRAVEEKFSVDLTGRPTMFTVRGQCGNRDGHIHTDTESKIITVLIYLNPSWEKDGGRLRLLRSDNLDDVAAEVPPDSGTLLLFRRSERSFHGHKKFIGPRKVVQMNWVTEQKFVDRNYARHGLSSFFKRLFGAY